MPVASTIKRNRKRAIEAHGGMCSSAAFEREEVAFQLAAAARFRIVNAHRINEQPAGARLIQSHGSRIHSAKGNRMAAKAGGFYLP